MLYRFKPFKLKSLREILMCSFSAVYQRYPDNSPHGQLAPDD